MDGGRAKRARSFFLDPAGRFKGPCTGDGRAKRARCFFLDPAGWFKVSAAGRVVALSGRGASF